MGQLRRLCVFCGSSIGRGETYRQIATELGTALVQRHCSLVYGGGRVGLMGVVTDAVLARGGSVLGVIPEFLASKEIMHPGVTELYTVKTMHERKALMAEKSDGFIAIPGGLGTYDEFCEIVTWAQLGLQAKPIGMLNVNGFFDGLLQQIDRAIADEFCKPEHRQLFVVADAVEPLLNAMEAYQPPLVSKWLQPGQI